MASRRRTTDEERPTPMKPATTPEEDERQAVALAMRLAKKQMEEGTASSQVITHFLKVGSQREQLEQDKLKGENVLLKAKAEQLESHKATEELFREALQAMRSYSGDNTPVHDVED